jgi:hypothetical protein
MEKRSGIPSMTTATPLPQLPAFKNILASSTNTEIRLLKKIT